MAPETEVKTQAYATDEDDFDISSLGGKAKEGGEQDDDNKNQEIEGAQGASNDGSGNLPGGSEGENDGEGTEGTEGTEGGEGKKIEDKKGTESTEGTKDKEGTEGTEGSSEPDFFGEEQLPEEGSGKSRDLFDYKTYAKTQFDLDIEENNSESFKKALDARMEESKKEFRINDFNPEVQKVIKHLNENGGSLADFLNNEKIVSYQAFLEKSPEEKYGSVREAQLLKEGKTQEEVEETIESELENFSTKQLRDITDNYDESIRGLWKQEVERITDEREQYIQKEKQKTMLDAEQERSSLKTLVDKTESILGVKLTDKGRQIIKSEIDSGRFDQIVDKNPGASKLFAYFMTKYGDSFLQKMEQRISDQKREGYNEAINKSHSELHNTPQNVVNKSLGREQKREGEKRGFDLWQDENLFNP